MKILSWNVNGLRSVCKKGFCSWLEKEKPEILCLQEIKIQEKEVPENLIQFGDYHSFFNCAQKKGYSGVAIYCKRKPVLVKKNLGQERLDREGRFIQLEFDPPSGGLTLINLYLPNGGRQKENLAYKLECYARLFKYLSRLKNKNVILTGDFNVAHQEIDLSRPKQNKNNTMFTPEERKQIEKLISMEFVDSFRKFHKEGGYHTWWPYMANCRKRNIGWRIDYGFVSKKLSWTTKRCFCSSRSSRFRPLPNWN